MNCSFDSCRVALSHSGSVRAPLSSPSSRASIASSNAASFETARSSCNDNPSSSTNAKSHDAVASLAEELSPFLSPPLFPGAPPALRFSRPASHSSDDTVAALKLPTRASQRPRFPLNSRKFPSSTSRRCAKLACVPSKRSASLCATVCTTSSSSFKRLVRAFTARDLNVASAKARPPPSLCVGLGEDRRTPGGGVGVPYGEPGKRPYEFESEARPDASRCSPGGGPGGGGGAGTAARASSAK
mmetsp:Transcript_12252/g.45609  ORF Transcript_12252/g.45609 Transcript_12252/m.45609 type:complete len:243 (+) Transcript_12252:2139-2867(+)